MTDERFCNYQLGDELYCTHRVGLELGKLRGQKMTCGLKLTGVYKYKGRYLHKNCELFSPVLYLDDLLKESIIKESCNCGVSINKDVYKKQGFYICESCGDEYK